MLPRVYRLRFGHKKILRFGQRKKFPFFILIYKSNNLSNSRFSIMATKKIGKAIVRNKVKRMFRELIREQMQHICDGYDIIIIPSHYIPDWKENHVDEVKPLLLNAFKSL